MAKLVTQLFNIIIQEKERPATFWRRKGASNLIPMFSEEMIRNFREDVKDGVLFSMYKIEKPKIAYVIELRNISDDYFPDEIWDDLNSILKKEPDKILEIHK